MLRVPVATPDMTSQLAREGQCVCADWSAKHKLIHHRCRQAVPFAFHERIHEQTRVSSGLAVQIPRLTLNQTNVSRVDMAPVRLALRCI